MSDPLTDDDDDDNDGIGVDYEEVEEIVSEVVEDFQFNFMQNDLLIYFFWMYAFSLHACYFLLLPIKCLLHVSVCSAQR